MWLVDTPRTGRRDAQHAEAGGMLQSKPTLPVGDIHRKNKGGMSIDEHFLFILMKTSVFI